jgi:hypothetical protein
MEGDDVDMDDSQDGAGFHSNDDDDFGGGPGDDEMVGGEGGAANDSIDSKVQQDATASLAAAV